jgi:hypothetical protein
VSNLPAITRAIPVLLMPLLFAGWVPARIAPAPDFGSYHTSEAMTAQLRELVKVNASIANLVEIGKTSGGRPVWAVEIASHTGAPADTRPAVLIAANFEGDQLFGSELALFMADFLLRSYGSNPEVKRLVDTQTFYIIPRLNADAAEGMFAPLKNERKTNLTAFDDDNDGRVDEDGPEDLNGDGMITMMRVKDPHGAWMIHPDDPRAMRKADPQKGETGAYSVYTEGIDNDGDGFINEDPPGGVDLNRNFQHRYPYYAPDAGPHMVSEPESRSLMDYVLKHRNIAAVLTFGESDNLVSPGRRGDPGPPSVLDMLACGNQSTLEARKTGIYEIGRASPFGFMFMFDDDEEDGPPGGGRGAQARPPRRPPMRPAETVNAADLEYFRAIAEKYRNLTGIRSTPATRTPAGAFFEFCYYQFGVPAFSTPGWGLPAPPKGEGERGPGRPQEESSPQGNGPAEASAAAGPPSPDGPRGPNAAAPPMVGSTAAFDLRMLKWMDGEKIDGFVKWAPYKHPKLGDVEIGGFRPYAAANPPAPKIAELGKTHCDFMLYLASLLPRITVAEKSVTALGGGLFRIAAEIQNSGFLPTSTAQGVTSRSVKPTMVQLEVAPSDIVSGDAKTSFFHALAGSGRRQKYQWIVKGKPGTPVQLKVMSQKGGTETVSLTLQ